MIHERGMRRVKVLCTEDNLDCSKSSFEVGAISDSITAKRKVSLRSPPAPASLPSMESVLREQ